MINLAAVLILLFLTACFPEKENKPSDFMENLNKCSDCAISKPILEE